MKRFNYLSIALLAIACASTHQADAMLHLRRATTRLTPLAQQQAFGQPKRNIVSFLLRGIIRRVGVTRDEIKKYESYFKGKTLPEVKKTSSDMRQENMQKRQRLGLPVGESVKTRTLNVIGLFLTTRTAKWDGYLHLRQLKITRGKNTPLVLEDYKNIHNKTIQTTTSKIASKITSKNQEEKAKWELLKDDPTGSKKQNTLDTTIDLKPYEFEVIKPKKKTN